MSFSTELSLCLLAGNIPGSVPPGLLGRQEDQCDGVRGGPHRTELGQRPEDLGAGPLHQTAEGHEDPLPLPGDELRQTLPKPNPQGQHGVSLTHLSNSYPLGT